MKNAIKFLGIFVVTTIALFVLLFVVLVAANWLVAWIVYVFENITTDTYMCALIIMAPILVILSVFVSIIVYKVNKYKGGIFKC